MQSTPDQEDDSQDNFMEARDPAELVMCIVLSAAFFGLAKYVWVPLKNVENWRLFFNIEGFFITVGLLSLVIGLRPYLSPCNLQLSKKGIKYQGPYSTHRKTVNWDQIFKLYVSPELVVALYHPGNKKKGIWPLIIQSVYLSDRERISSSIQRYCPVPPIFVRGPSWTLRLLFVFLFVITVISILQLLVS